MKAEEAMDTEEEGCDHESPKSEESDIDDSEHSTLSETEESSEVDEETIDVRKSDCLADGHELEKAFQLVKSLLYDERMKQIDLKLENLRNEMADEYLKPLKLLDEKLNRRAQVAAKRKEFRIQMIDVIYESERLAAQQNLENDKLQLYDLVRHDLEERIRMLEEDRHAVDIHSDLWESQLFSKKLKVKKGPISSKERRKKPVAVSGPCIIYMLSDSDILDDWTAIKKAVKQKQQLQKKLRPVSHASSRGSGGAAGGQEKHYLARYQGGRLNYRGEFYNCGHHIIIDNKEDSPVHATIAAINTDEICVKKSDGNKSKLFIAQLQRGKYTIRRVPY